MLVRHPTPANTPLAQRTPGATLSRKWSSLKSVKSIMSESTCFSCLGPVLLSPIRMKAMRICHSGVALFTFLRCSPSHMPTTCFSQRFLSVPSISGQNQAWWVLKKMPVQSRDLNHLESSTQPEPIIHSACALACVFKCTSSRTCGIRATLHTWCCHTSINALESLEGFTCLSSAPARSEGSQQA